MFRLFVSIILVFVSFSAKAQEASPYYQVDLIIFTHQTTAFPAEQALTMTLSTKNSATPLHTEISKNLTPYHLLPFSASQLREEYWALHRQPEYRVLLHYSWLQSNNNQHTIALPSINRNGWKLEGFIHIQQASYYLLNSELLFSTPDNSHPAFVFAQQQRLKGGDTYYFDHPAAGMLIKIHSLG